MKSNSPWNDVVNSRGIRWHHGVNNRLARDYILLYSYTLCCAPDHDDDVFQSTRKPNAFDVFTVITTNIIPTVDTGHCYKPQTADEIISCSRRRAFGTCNNILAGDVHEITKRLENQKQSVQCLERYSRRIPLSPSRSTELNFHLLKSATFFWTFLWLLITCCTTGNITLLLAISLSRNAEV